MSDRTKVQTPSEIGKRRLSARKENSSHYNERRQILHAAAATLFKERGFKETSLDDIAKAAGLDRSSLYYYTASKKQLFFDIVLEAMAGVVSLIHSISAHEGPPRDKIERLISAMMENYETNYPYMYVFLQEHLTEAFAEGTPQLKKLTALAREVDDALLALLRDGAADGSLRDDLPLRMSAHAILGMVNWTHRWFRPNGQLSGKQVAAIFYEILMNGLASK